MRSGSSSLCALSNPPVSRRSLGEADLSAVLTSDFPVPSPNRKNALFTCRQLLQSSRLGDILYDMVAQPRGVTVAQVVLVHSAQVRILAGLPIFFGGRRRVCPDRCRASSLRLHDTRLWYISGRKTKYCTDIIKGVAL